MSCYPCTPAVLPEVRSHTWTGKANGCPSCVPGTATTDGHAAACCSENVVTKAISSDDITVLVTVTERKDRGDGVLPGLMGSTHSWLDQGG